MNSTSITTYSGHWFDFDNVEKNVIDKVDIAHSLGMSCRFNGHISRFYSVAEHCVALCDWFIKEKYDWGVCLWALMHDAAEAYIGDIVTPLKVQLGYNVMYLEERIMDHIWNALKLPDLSIVEKLLIKRIEERLLINEIKTLHLHSRILLEKYASVEPLEEVIISGLSPYEASSNFLKKYEMIRSHFIGVR